MTTREAIITILVVAAATALTRFLPFAIFTSRKRTPEYILYLGRVLPYSVIGLLVVYCLKDVKPLVWPYGLPEAIAVAGTALVHLWKRNYILSIAGGTFFYLFLIRVF